MTPRSDSVKAVLADAKARDDLADTRDTLADERERAASLHAFVHPNDDQHEPGMKARRDSAIDRIKAKADRVSSAEDRTKLSDG